MDEDKTKASHITEQFKIQTDLRRYWNLKGLDIT